MENGQRARFNDEFSRWKSTKSFCLRQTSLICELNLAGSPTELSTSIANLCTEKKSRDSCFLYLLILFREPKLHSSQIHMPWRKELCLGTQRRAFSRIPTTKLAAETNAAELTDSLCPCFESTPCLGFLACFSSLRMSRRFKKTMERQALEQRWLGDAGSRVADKVLDHG